MFAVKRELRLSNVEKSLMARHAGFARFVYNYGLELYRLSVREGVTGSDYKRLLAIKKCLTNVTKKRSEYVWMRELSSRVYQSAFQALGRAYSRWRSGVAGQPTFKRRRDGQSFTVYDSSGPVLLHAGKTIRLPTLGTFRLKEALWEAYVSQTFTISCEAGRWYVAFSVHAERISPISHEVVDPVGIDLGVSCFATLSDGTEVFAPKPLKQAITKLKRFQYRNRHKDFGDRRSGQRASKNARKYFDKVARLHRQVANRRQDFLHKTTTAICRRYAHIRIEDLNVSGMLTNHKIAAAIQDVGFYEFRRQLEYKAAAHGCTLEVVDRWYPSSRQCRVCGHRNGELTLKDRIFLCPVCRHTEPRDLHAARNLASAPIDVCNRVGSTRLKACGAGAADGLR